MSSKMQYNYDWRSFLLRNESHAHGRAIRARCVVEDMSPLLLHSELLLSSLIRRAMAASLFLPSTINE